MDIPLEGKTIYIVDDSPIIIARVKELLEGIRAIGKISAAGTYESARGLLLTETPHIILLDIHLAGKSGIDLLIHVKEQYPEVTVIMLTNQATGHYRSLCASLGAAHFIDKSTEFDRLPEILASFL